MSNFEKNFNSGKMRNKRWPIWFAFTIVFGAICYFLPKPYGAYFAVATIVPSFLYLVYKGITKKR